MPIKMKYDPAADRMRLRFQPEEGEARVFWLRRNQCIGLLNVLSTVANKMGVKPQLIQRLQVAPGPIPKDPELDDVTPIMLDVVRVRRHDDEVRVWFVYGEDSVGLKLDDKTLKTFLDAVGEQAEHAGWDPVAGVRRVRELARQKAAADAEGKAADPAPH